MRLLHDNLHDLTDRGQIHAGRVSVYGREEQIPDSFAFAHSIWRVREVLENWYEAGPLNISPTYCCLKVLTTQGEIFILRYNCCEKNWAVCLS